MEAEGEKVDSAPRTGVPGDSRSRFALVINSRSPRHPHFLFSFENWPRPLVETACSLKHLSLTGRSMWGLRGIIPSSGGRQGVIPERMRRTFRKRGLSRRAMRKRCAYRWEAMIWTPRKQLLKDASGHPRGG